MRGDKGHKLEVCDAMAITGAGAPPARATAAPVRKGRAFWALWASTPARGNVVAMVSFWAYSGLDEHRGEGGLSGAGAPPYSARVRKGSVSTEGGAPAAQPALFARLPRLRPVFTGCIGSSLRC